jgi:hypothetical protein
VTYIEVTTDTLEIQFLLVLVIIEVSRYAVIGNTLGEEINVTSLTRLVIDDSLSILQLALAIPIDILGILGHIRPQILCTCSYLSLNILERAFGREVTSGAIGLSTAAVVIVYRLLPTRIRLGVEVASHTRFVLRRVHPHIVEGYHQRKAQHKTCEQSQKNSFLTT